MLHQPLQAATNDSFLVARDHHGNLHGGDHVDMPLNQNTDLLHLEENPLTNLPLQKNQHVSQQNPIFTPTKSNHFGGAGALNVVDTVNPKVRGVAINTAGTHQHSSSSLELLMCHEDLEDFHNDDEMDDSNQSHEVGHFPDDYPFPDDDPNFTSPNEEAEDMHMISTSQYIKFNGLALVLNGTGSGTFNWDVCAITLKEGPKIYYFNQILVSQPGFNGPFLISPMNWFFNFSLWSCHLLSSALPNYSFLDPSLQSHQVDDQMQCSSGLKRKFPAVINVYTKRRKSSALISSSSIPLPFKKRKRVSFHDSVNFQEHSFSYAKHFRLVYPRAKKTFRNLGYSCFTGTNPVGRSGGTFLSWQEDRICNIIDISPNWIHISTKDESGNDGVLTFIYNFPDMGMRSILWNWFRNVSIVINVPWAAIGDFKQISIVVSLILIQMVPGSLGRMAEGVMMLYGHMFRGNNTLQVEETIQQLGEYDIPVLLQSHLDVLNKPFSMDECLSALNQMKLDGAPGPDGALLSQINNTYITLIPKVNAPQNFKDFRPISLANGSYKLATKVLCNRLKQFLPDLIAPNQSAFLKGRLVGDNILLATELMHKIKNTRTCKTGWCALKLDIQNAYDKLSWNFIEVVLRKMGKHEDGKLWRGVKIRRRSTALSHLMYADDILLFFEANDHNCRAVRHVINEYADLAGQKMNARTWIDCRESKKNVIQETISKIEHKLRDWKAKLLSQAGLALCNAKYMDSGSMLKVPSTSSWHWKDIMKHKDIIFSNLHWQIGDGILHRVYGQQTTNIIASSPIFAIGVRDRLLWTCSSDGQYSVKEGSKKPSVNGREEGSSFKCHSYGVFLLGSLKGCFCKSFFPEPLSNQFISLERVDSRDCHSPPRCVNYTFNQDQKNHVLSSKKKEHFHPSFGQRAEKVSKLQRPARPLIRDATLCFLRNILQHF
ncbi:ribonuclease H [Senna tora]|uniref:Ribonuclease H n=1 Tax=Senna tora TaxID=362788 RepID=A0A834TRG9_9FABA|nr:ribonuclease H [Senna tora]